MNDDYFFLAYWREKRGLTQEQLSVLTGISTVTLWRYENKVTEPRARDIRTLCTVLEITENELLRGPVRKQWQIRVIVDNDEWGSRSMNMTAESNNEVLVFVTPTKIGVQVVGKVEDDEEIEELLDRVRSKIKDAREFQKKSVQ